MKAEARRGARNGRAEILSCHRVRGCKGDASSIDHDLCPRGFRSLKRKRRDSLRLAYGLAAPSRCSGRGPQWTPSSRPDSVHFGSNLWAIPSVAASPSSSLRYGEGLAEAEGFEPPVGCPTAVFKTAAFDHSATLPRAEMAEIAGKVKVRRGRGDLSFVGGGLGAELEAAGRLRGAQARAGGKGKKGGFRSGERRARGNASGSQQNMRTMERPGKSRAWSQQIMRIWGTASSRSERASDQQNMRTMESRRGCSRPSWTVGGFDARGGSLRGEPTGAALRALRRGWVREVTEELLSFVGSEMSCT